MTQKQTSVILDANGGLHSKRALKKVKTNLQNHGLKRAILVHMVLTGSQTVQVYRDTYNDIADHIRDNGSRCEYFGCLEMDEVKGLHAHVLFVIETSKKFPHATLDVNDNAWLHRLAERRGLVGDDGKTKRIHIAQPQNKMHYAKGKPQFFARLNDEAKLADCLERIEYLYKNRSKEGVPCREVYFNSEFKSNAAKQAAKKAIALDSSPIDAPASKEEAISTEDKGNDMTTLTPAFKYVAGIYETAVDAGMNVAEIQAHLKDKGIVRSLWQVRNDLSNVFGFTGYADAHTAPPRPNVAELDKMIDTTPLMALTKAVAKPTPRFRAAI